MGKIINDNCKGICCEKYCDEKHKWFIEKKIYGLNVYITFCDEHYEQVKENMEDEE